MDIRVLGPAQVWRDGAQVDLGTRKQRALLAALALHAGRAVSVDGIIDLLWGDDAPPAVTATLQAYVAGLRRALEPSRQRRAPAALLVTIPPGYALRLPLDQLDAERFTRSVTAQRQVLSPVSTLVPTGRARLGADELTEAVDALRSALELWRGEPYAELEDAADARAERTRLEELRLLAEEDLALATMWLGHDATAAAELEALTKAHPLRERLWGVRALALVRSGRQADALDVLREVRQVLDDELGLEPSPELRALQTAVLRQDPALQWRARAAEDPPAPRPSPTPRPPAAAAAAAPGPVSSWPLVGRGRELATLSELLGAAEQTGPCFASLVGEPGIGKTRLAGEVVGIAGQRDLTVLSGRCSQDDGAPPLWPWAAVLAGLGGTLPSSDGSDPDSAQTQFAAWEDIVAQVIEAARQRTVLLVLDDLHWADSSSLRVLRLLVETRESCRLMVLLTWRSHPEPTGALADVAEALARRHATQLSLAGLSTAEAAQVVHAVTSNEPSTTQAGVLRDRTDGNPFFLVEYGRLAAERGDLAVLLDADDRPAAVRDVLVARLARLPEPTRAALAAAGVVGRQFDLATLVAAGGADEDALLDALEPAITAGLLREDGIDRFSFAHALVRDTVEEGLGASRRARLHARIASALSERAGRETEAAHHWFAAGPAHRARAWRAAVAAAAQARQVHAHEQSAKLLADAWRAMTDDATAEPLDRYEVGMQLIDAYRWAASWPELVRTVETEIEVAEEIGDVELLARAACSTTLGALWQSAAQGEVHEGIVAALRRSLERLPGEDSATRCRVMVSLANELYYGTTFAERLALIEEALAMAVRLDDERLQLDVYQVACMAVRSSSTAERRLDYATRAVELCERLGEEQALVVSVSLRAVIEAELGRVDEMWASAATARAESERLHIPFGLIVVDSLELGWLAMAGRAEESDARLAEIARLDAQLSLDQSEDAAGSALMSLRIWQGGEAEVAALLQPEEGEGPNAFTPLILSLLLRSGQLEQARRHYAEHPVTLPEDSWLAMLLWCTAAEAASGLDDHTLAAEAYALLAPYAGRSCAAGVSLTLGPVDAFLALAAAGVGEASLATRHADQAEELMERWRIPLVARWFRDRRAQLNF